MADDSSRGRPSLALPLIAIALGVIFLYANWRPAFDPWSVLRTWWPLALILLGLGKIWDNMRAQPEGSGRTPIGALAGAVIFIVVIAALVWHGRGHHGQWDDVGRLSHSTEAVELQGATSVHESIEMGAGRLEIKAGSSRLLDADFHFSGAWAQPHVDYFVSNGAGDLTISQESGPHVGMSRNRWQLRMNPDVPTQLKITLGAGQSDLNLSGINVTRLDLEMGAGQAQIDLTGSRKSDLEANIEGGVGQATVKLPKDSGVIATASGGIGSISVSGLTRNSDEYTNAAYGKSPHTIRLKVEGGIGTINLVEAP
jgi:hypothetical protein